MRHASARRLLTTSFVAALLLPGAAIAIDWNITGAVRQEIVYGIASNENEFNEMGNPYQSRSMPVLTTNPLNGALLRSDGLQADAYTTPIPTTCKFLTVAACAAPGASNLAGAALEDDFNFNLFNSRLDHVDHGVCQPPQPGWRGGLDRRAPDQSQQHRVR